MHTIASEIPQETQEERRARLTALLNERLASRDFEPGIAGEIPDKSRPGFFESTGKLIKGASEGIAAGLNRVAGGGLSRDIKGAFAGNVQSQASLVGKEGLFLLNGLNSGLLSPAANIIDFVAEVADVVGLDQIEAAIRKQSEIIRGTVEGVITQAEDIARRVGIDERSIAQSSIGGTLAGFLFPLGASLKVASSLTRIRGVSFAQNITRDFVAGNLLGLFDTEGDLVERGKAAVYEGGIFGSFALVGAMFPWLKAYRNKRRVTSGRFSAEIVESSQKEIAVGQATIKEGKEAATFELMAEEEIISQSPRARDILVKNADVDAMVAGLADVASDRTGHVIMRRIADREAFLAKTVELFPGMKVSFAKGVEGHNAVISFGGKGLNNTQKSQFAKTGMFEGFRVLHSGVEKEIAGLSKRAGFIKVRPLSGGKTSEVKIENLSLFGSARSIEVAPGNDGLFREFKRWFDDRLDSVARSGGTTVTKEQLVDDINKGRFALDELKLRDTVGESVLLPSEAGLDATQKIVFDLGSKPGVRINVKPVSPAELQLTPQQAEGKAFLQVLRGENPVNAMLEITRTERGLLVTGLDGASLGSLPRRTTKVLGERIAELVPDVQRIDMLGVREPVFESIEAHIARGGDDFFIVPPQTLGSFDDVVGVWMREQGIAGADAQIFREFAVQRMRRELFESLPSTEKALITDLRNQYANILKEGRVDIEFLATSQGFKFERGSGESVKLTDVTTGAKFVFKDEKGVKEALRVARTRRDLVESSMLPDDFAAIAPPHSPNIAPTGEIPSVVAISNESIAKAFLADVPEAKIFNNLADVAKRFERDTQFPLFTSYLDDVIEGSKKMRNANSLDFPNIERNWLRLGHGRAGQASRIKVVDVWESMQGKTLSREQINIIAKGAGLTSKEISVMTRAMDIFDVGAVRAGIPPGEFVTQYFSRIRPRVQAGTEATRVALYGSEPVPPTSEAFFRHVRRGHMDPIEKDPLLVQLAWFRAQSHEEFLGKAFDKMAELTGFGRARIPAMKIKDLPPGQQAGLKKLYDETGIPFNGNSSVLPEQIADIYNTMLMNIHGGQQRTASSLTKIFSTMYRFMGVDVSEVVLKQHFNDLLSGGFGALVGSGKAVARNATTQINFMDYTRYGGKHLGRAIEVAGTEAGYNKALADGVFSLREGGVAGGDILHQRLIAPGTGGIDARNTFGRFIAPAVRLQVKLGNLSQRLAKKVLVPFSSTDDINRARSYYNTRFAVEDEIALFKAGKLTEQEFKDNAMQGFIPEMKDEFFRRFKVSEERALQYVGTRVVNENHFLYGLSTQPLYLQTTAGKLAGMFSSWPLWAKEFYFFRFNNLTAAQKRVFIARTSISTAALGMTGTVLGFNLWSWVSPLAIFNYSGGPLVDVAEGIRDIISLPIDRKAGAVQRVGSELGRMAFPGQQLGRDFNRSLEDSNDPHDMVLGLILGRQTDRGLEIDYSDLLNEKDRVEALRLSGQPDLSGQPIEGITGAPIKPIDPRVFNERINQQSVNLGDQIRGTAQPTDRLPVAQP